MADNVPITAGSGTSIATDDVAGAHYQRVKIDGGGDGAAGPILGDSTNGLDVDVTRLPALVAGTANIGDVDVASLPVTSPIGVLGANHQTGTASATGTSDTSVIAAPGSGSFLYITTITVHNSSVTDTFVNIKDGTTTRLVLPAPAKGGAVVSLPVPLRLSDNAALQFASGAAVTTMFVSAVGYKAAA